MCVGVGPAALYVAVVSAIFHVFTPPIAHTPPPRPRFMDFERFTTSRAKMDLGDYHPAIKLAYELVRALPGGENPWVPGYWMVVIIVCLTFGLWPITRAVWRIFSRVVMTMGRVSKRTLVALASGARQVRKIATFTNETSEPKSSKRSDIKIELPSFAKVDDFRLWRQLFQIFSQHHNHPRELLLARLDGDVRAQLDEAILRRQPKAPINQMLDYLDAQFGRVVLPNGDDILEFGNYTQQPTQTILEFIQQYRLRATVAFSTLSEVDINELVRKRFVSRLYDRDVTNALMLALKDKASLLEAIDSAVWCEDIVVARRPTANQNLSSTFPTITN